MQCTHRARYLIKALSDYWVDVSLAIDEYWFSFLDFSSRKQQPALSCTFKSHDGRRRRSTRGLKNDFISRCARILESDRESKLSSGKGKFFWNLILFLNQIMVWEQLGSTIEMFTFLSLWNHIYLIKIEMMKIFNFPPSLSDGGVSTGSTGRWGTRRGGNNLAETCRDIQFEFEFHEHRRHFVMIS